MEIRQIPENKRYFLPLLLLGDDPEDMIWRSLDRGSLRALSDGGRLRTVAVVTDEGGGVFELKNLATEPDSQRRGYGRAMVEHIIESCRGRGTRLLAGTGDSPLTIPFYERLGFQESRRVRNFFTDHYDHPIYEAGRQLVDMVYLAMEL